MKSFPSPKINLGLSVLRKRPDGYHDIETLFVPYKGISDELEIVEAPETSIVIDGKGVNWDPWKDLTMKAYRLLKEDFDLPPVSIRLVKNVPVGAGLGGGSSDAVEALKTLNEMFSLGLDTAGLIKYAASLGADCPFFVLGKPVIGRGIGDEFEDYSLDLSDYVIKVEMPEGVTVNTKEAYGGIVPREKMEKAPMPLLEALALPVEQWEGRLVNDFEKTVCAAHPEILDLKERFYKAGAVYAAMSGSGAAVFGLFRK